MKTLLASLCLAILFVSCDPNADNRVGRRPNLNNNSSGSSGSAGATGAGGGIVGTGSAGATPTDAPLDGGLGVLLVAGAAYGVKRVRGKKRDNA